MAIIEYERDGIIDLSAGDIYENDRTPVGTIILSGTAAGMFVLKLGNASLNIVTGAADLTKQINVGRKLNSVELVSGPTGAHAYVFRVK